MTPLETRLLSALDGRWRTLKSLRLVDNTRQLIGPAQRLRSRGLVESRIEPSLGHLVHRRAPVIEARKAETQRNSVGDESAAPAGETPDAQ